MYLTAQKVRSSTGDEGINVYVHTHQGAEPSGVDWNHPDVAFIADHVPGSHVAAMRTVVAPGASVLAFLDIVAEESLPLSTVAALLRAEVERGAEHGPSETWHAGPMGLRLFVGRAERATSCAVTFQALGQALLAVLEGASAEQESSTGVGATRHSFVVERRPTSVGHRYVLDRASRVLAETLGLTPTAEAVSVSSETEELFAALVGRSIQVEVARVLTGLADAQVTFVDADRKGTA